MRQIFINFIQQSELNVKIWEFITKHAGKISSASGAITIIIAGTAIVFPPSGVLYAAMLVGTGTGLAVSSAIAGYWVGTKNTEGQPVTEIVSVSEEQKILELAEKLWEFDKRLDKKLEEKEQKDQQHHQEVVGIKDQLNASDELHSLEHAELVEGQEEISAQISDLKSIIAELQGQVDSLSISHHSMFAKPEHPDNSNNQFPSIGAQFH